MPPSQYSINKYYRKNYCSLLIKCDSWSFYPNPSFSYHIVLLYVSLSWNELFKGQFKCLVIINFLLQPIEMNKHVKIKCVYFSPPACESW